MKKLFTSVSALVLSAAPMAALAQGGLNEFKDTTNLGNTELVPAVANIINILLGFLGVIAIVIIVIAGFKWMTAAGNEEQISSAKKMLGAGIIGLVIILAAFAIASFVMSNLNSELGATLNP